MEVADILKVIDIRRSEISDITFEFLSSNPIAYSDNLLNEDMYNVSSIVDSIREKEIYTPSLAVQAELNIMVRLCEKHDAGYIRIIDIE